MIFRDERRAAAEAPAALAQRFRLWLKHFPKTPAQVCAERMTSSSEYTWVLSPSRHFARFRLNAGECVYQVLHTLEHASCHLPLPGYVVWGLENHSNQGLDDFEVEALLGTWVDIDVLHQVDRGAPVSRILASGRLREEVIGLAVHLNPADAPETLSGGLQLLLAAQIPISTIFIDASAPGALDRIHGVQESVLRLLQTSGAAPALELVTDSPPGEEGLAQALHDLQVWTGQDIRQLRFKHSDFLSGGGTRAVFQNAGIRLDSSSSITPAADADAPYVRGSYQPHEFDLLVPSGLWDAQRWIECPLWTGFRDLEGLWQARQALQIERLSSLLNFSRMEKYYLETAHTPALNQRYPEYRIYNWPPSEPSPRSTLIDCGSISDPALKNRILEVRSLQERLGKRWTPAGFSIFFPAAMAEAQRRSHQSVASAVAEQIEAHTYLETTRAAPLREDIRQFVEFLPEVLGSVLEIGSGNGQLAQVLWRRALSYTCTDLSGMSTIPSAANVRLRQVRSNIHELPFAGESFDTVIANNILEHLYEPSACLKELRRVLRPGGKLFALIPLDALNSAYQLRAHLWKAHPRHLRQALAGCGLTTLRSEVMNLYDLGVNAAFPSCNGLVCKLEAQRLPADREDGAGNIARPQNVL